jgi:hypothetical protein
MKETSSGTRSLPAAQSCPRTPPRTGRAAPALKRAIPSPWRLPRARQIRAADRAARRHRRGTAKEAFPQWTCLRLEPRGAIKPRSFERRGETAADVFSARMMPLCPLPMEFNTFAVSSQFIAVSVPTRPEVIPAEASNAPRRYRGFLDVGRFNSSRAVSRNGPYVFLGIGPKTAPGPRT